MWLAGAHVDDLHSMICSISWGKLVELTGYE